MTNQNVTYSSLNSMVFFKFGITYSVISHLYGWVQDCSHTIANADELLQCCTKPSICICDQIQPEWYTHDAQWHEYTRIHWHPPFSVTELFYYNYELVRIQWPETHTYMWVRYNAVNFLANPHKRHPIARPLGWGTGCPLWVHTLIDILL